MPKKEPRRQAASYPKNTKDGKAIQETEKELRGKKQFLCPYVLCKKRVGFGSARMLDLHIQNTHDSNEKKYSGM